MAFRSARNRRLSRAGQAVQPEDARRVLPIGPAVYLFEEVDTRIGKAGWIVLSLVCVERRVCSGRQGFENVVQVYGRLLVSLVIWFTANMLAFVVP